MSPKNEPIPFHVLDADLDNFNVQSNNFAIIFVIQKTSPSLVFEALFSSRNKF